MLQDIFSLYCPRSVVVLIEFGDGGWDWHDGGSGVNDKILLIVVDSSLTVQKEEWWQLYKQMSIHKAAEVQIQQARHNKEHITIFRKSILVISKNLQGSRLITWWDNQMRVREMMIDWTVYRTEREKIDIYIEKEIISITKSELIREGTKQKHWEKNTNQARGLWRKSLRTKQEVRREIASAPSPRLMDQ